MFDLLGGHPYLTRQCLYVLVKTPQLNWARLKRRASAEMGPFYDHLRQQLWFIFEQPDLKRTILNVIYKKRCSDKSALQRLIQSGIVKGVGDVYTTRCRLYQQYLVEKL